MFFCRRGRHSPVRAVHSRLFHVGRLLGSARWRNSSLARSPIERARMSNQPCARRCDSPVSWIHGATRRRVRNESNHDLAVGRQRLKSNVGPWPDPTSLKPVQVDIVEAASETIHQHCRRRVRIGRIAAAASRRPWVGRHNQWHSHSILGERHRLRGGGYPCVQGST